MDLKQAGDLLYLVGNFDPAFGGSHFNLVNSNSAIEESIPLCSELNPQLYRTLYHATQQRLVTACHDLSEGGLAVSIAEMMIAGRLGARLELDSGADPLRFLFGETSGCLLVEVSPKNKAAFETIINTMPCRLLGTTEVDPTLNVTYKGISLVNIELPQLVSAWKDRKIEGTQI
jgi:phosphoribosylformylglycinamidine synthase